MRAAAWAPVWVLKELVVSTTEAGHAGHGHPDVGPRAECGHDAGRAWAAASILQVPFLSPLTPLRHNPTPGVLLWPALRLPLGGSRSWEGVANCSVMFWSQTMSLDCGPAPGAWHQRRCP